MQQEVKYISYLSIVLVTLAVFELGYNYYTYSPTQSDQESKKELD
jgi:hypothetical protein